MSSEMQKSVTSGSLLMASQLSSSVQGITSSIFVWLTHFCIYGDFKHFCLANTFFVFMVTSALGFNESHQVEYIKINTKSHLCTCMWGSDRLRAGRQEVGKCSTRGESWGMYITFTSAKIANKAEPTLALKPRGNVTRNPKQGYQKKKEKD